MYLLDKLFKFCLAKNEIIILLDNIDIYILYINNIIMRF